VAAGRGKSRSRGCAARIAVKLRDVKLPALAGSFRRRREVSFGGKIGSGGAVSVEGARARLVLKVLAVREARRKVHGGAGGFAEPMGGFVEATEASGRQWMALWRGKGTSGTRPGDLRGRGEARCEVAPWRGIRFVPRAPRGRTGPRCETRRPRPARLPSASDGSVTAGTVACRFEAARKRWNMAVAY